MKAGRFAAVLCDLDGTLIDSRHDIAAALQWALRCVRGVTPPPSAITPHIGKPLEQMAAALGYPLTPAQLPTFLETYRQYYALHCVCSTRPYPGVEATLRDLAHLAWGIVTTKLQEQAEIVVRQLDLTPLFQHIQGWQPGLRVKPAPDTLLRALGALGYAPEQALMVGDTPADILAGKAAGVPTCAVTYGYGSLEDLLSCAPEYVVHSFAEVRTILASGAAPG